MFTSGEETAAWPVSWPSPAGAQSTPAPGAAAGSGVSSDSLESALGWPFQCVCWLGSCPVRVRLDSCTFLMQNGQKKKLSRSAPCAFNQKVG